MVLVSVTMFEERFVRVYNLFIGHMTSYNNCIFHLVTVTLDTQNLGSFI